jgi:hypothetical protein
VGKKKIALLVAATLAALPIGANAASVTYDFTGTIVSADGVFAAASGPITGTFTVNLAAANPLQSSAAVSMSSLWGMGAYGGASFASSGANLGFPCQCGPAPMLPANVVFSSTISGSGFSFATPGIAGSHGVRSAVEGVDVSGQGGTPNEWAGDDYVENSTGLTSFESTMHFNGNPGAAPPYTIAGLPNFTLATQGGFGQLFNGAASNSFLTYEITSVSLAPVPLPASAWLLLSALGGLGVLGRRRDLG